MEAREQERIASRSAERVAFNDDMFRKANDTIHERVGEGSDFDSEPLPVICECAETSCTTVVQVPMQEYERVRADPRLFFNAPGHDVSSNGWAAVVERHEGYVVAEKLGRAGELVEMLDDDR